MRLKKDHTGYHSHGLWQKYQSPSVVEPTSTKSKKDTAKWCRGKVGVEHNYHAYQRKQYSWRTDSYVLPYVEVKCISCGKKGYKKASAALKYPYHVFINQVCETTPIQVRLSNGTYSQTDNYHEAHFI